MLNTPVAASSLTPLQVGSGGSGLLDGRAGGSTLHGALSCSSERGEWMQPSFRAWTGSKLECTPSGQRSAHPAPCAPKTAARRRRGQRRGQRREAVGAPKLALPCNFRCNAPASGSSNGTCVVPVLLHCWARAQWKASRPAAVGGLAGGLAAAGAPRHTPATHAPAASKHVQTTSGRDMSLSGSAPRATLLESVNGRGARGAARRVTDSCSSASRLFGVRGKGRPRRVGDRARVPPVVWAVAR